MCDLNGQRFEPQTSRSRDERVTAQPTGRLEALVVFSIFRFSLSIKIWAIQLFVEPIVASQIKRSSTRTLCHRAAQPYLIYFKIVRENVHAQVLRKNIVK